jgi:uncharacterized protein involved in exopolysaccharide biosynthesis
MAQEPSSIARHDDGYYQGGRTPSTSDQWHFVDYLRLLSKRRWTGIPVFLLVVVGVALMTYTATPVYEARTQLLIEAETQNVVTFQEVVEQERTTVEYYTTQYMILQSRALARTTIEKLKLWTHPELVGPPAEDKAAQAAAESERSASGVMSRALRMVEGAVTRLLGPQRADATFNAPKNSESAAPDETTAQSLAIQTFLSHLTVTPVRNSRLVDVKYRSTNPQLAASVANALSQAYVDRTLEFKLSASKEAADWLANQLSSQKEKVEESEKALQSYREKNTALSTEDAQIVEKLSHLNAMLTQTKTDRLQKELMYKQVVSHQGDRETLQTFPAIAATPAVQRLKGELSDLQRDEARYSKDFGDKWPALTAVRTAIKATEAKLDAEIENGIKLIYNDVEAARAPKTASRARSTPRRPTHWRATGKRLATKHCSGKRRATARFSTR